MSVQLAIEQGPLTPELLEKAEKELRETKERREEALEELRRLIKDDGTLYYKTTDDILIRYLRPTKFYPESALALMKRESDFKLKHQDVIKDLMPEKLESILLSEKILNVLADRDHMGRRILVHKTGKMWDPSKVTPDQVFQMFYLVHQYAMIEPATQVNGVVVILDFDGLGMTQALALNLSFSRRLLTFVQESMPLRLKEVHVVNQPWLFKMIWKLFKPFLQEKLSQRIHLHGTKLDDLHKFIPKDHLPPEYGGNLPPVNYSSKEWYPILRTFDDYIRENNTFGIARK